MKEVVEGSNGFEEEFVNEHDGFREDLKFKVFIFPKSGNSWNKIMKVILK